MKSPYEHLLYGYWDSSAGPNAGRLESITEQCNDTPGTASWNYVRMVTYTYYDGTPDNSGQIDGLPGDLEEAVVQTSPDGSTWAPGTDTYYYRYYTDAAHAHLLEMALSPEGFANAAATNPNPTALSNSNLEQYSSVDYTYNLDRQVTSATLDGVTGRVYQYAYNPGSSSTEYNASTEQTVETRPDGSTYTVYTNFLGEVLVADLASSAAPPVHSATMYQYGGDSSDSYEAGLVILEAAPSAVSIAAGSLNFGSYSVKSGSGLFYEYDYYASTAGNISDTQAGGVAGYLETEKLLDGDSQFQQASADTLETYTYYAHTGLADPDPAHQYSATIYPTATVETYATANDLTDNTATTTAYYVWWTVPVDDVYEPTLQPKLVTTAEPAVSIGQNGPGSTGPVAGEYYNAAGELAWMTDGRGALTAYICDPVTGAVTEEIDDVNTGNNNPGLGSPPSFNGLTWATQPGFGLNLVTDYYYDFAGRLQWTLGPEHDAVVGGVGGASTDIRTTTQYAYCTGGTGTIYLGDNAVTLSVADPYETWTVSGYTTLSGTQWTNFIPSGTISVGEYDHDGNLVGEGEKVLSGSSPKGTPGGYCRYTAYVYDNAGQLTDTQVFSNIANGTYSQTSYQYDVMGRQDYVEDPSGTITYTTYDARG